MTFTKRLPEIVIECIVTVKVANNQVIIADDFSIALSICYLAKKARPVPGRLFRIRSSHRNNPVTCP